MLGKRCVDVNQIIIIINIIIITITILEGHRAIFESKTTYFITNYLTLAFNHFQANFNVE